MSDQKRGEKLACYCLLPLHPLTFLNVRNTNGEHRQKQDAAGRILAFLDHREDDSIMHCFVTATWHQFGINRLVFVFLASDVR